MTEMTEDAFGKNWEMKRRDVLRSAAVMGAVGTFGLPAFSGGVAASSHATETIYLSHSVDSENVTKLFSVDLDSTAGEAVLAEVTSIGGNFQNVDAVAATPDGETVMFVDRNTTHLGEYDVSADSFTDRGAITGLPTISVLAAYGLDGNLYVASNNTNKLYTVDDSVSPPVATEVGTIDGATVNGADIVVDSTGTMFLHTNNNDTLYTIDYQNPDGNGNIAATVVGSDPGSSLTGLAVRAAGTGDLVGSSRADDAIVVIDKTDGSRTATLDMTLGGNAYSYTNGDMATGTIIDETCDECTSEDLLAKYEFACVEEVDGECVAWDFVLEGDGDDEISYMLGNFDSKDDEEFEPITATFETDYCDLAALVKGGRVEEWVEVTVEDGEATVTIDFEDSPFENDKNGKLFAISYVEFYCEEPAA